MQWPHVLPTPADVGDAGCCCLSVRLENTARFRRRGLERGQNCRVLLWKKMAFREPPALLGAGEQDKVIAGGLSQLHSSSIAP